jgi:hypothetical protein
MKLKIIALTALVLIASCKRDDGGIQDNNPYLTNPIVNLTLNLNLPQYDPLKFPGNSLVITQQGIKGIVVYNVNNDLYTASELSDPNHIPNSCSRMELDGIILSCPCENDNNEYDIVTGQHRTNNNAYPIQQYRIVRTGDVLQVTN